MQHFEFLEGKRPASFPSTIDFREFDTYPSHVNFELTEEEKMLYRGIGAAAAGGGN